MNRIWFVLLTAFMAFCTVRVNAQLRNPGYTGALAVQDSVIWQPAYHQPYGQWPDINTTGLELRFPIQKKQFRNYFDPRALTPKNRLMLDYRGSSYYVPRQINNRLARIMNRPSPDAFMPVFVVAALAVKIALQQVEIENKIRIVARDYLVDESLFPILAALWKESPQTAAALFRKSAVANHRTMRILLQQLDDLLERKIVKIKFQENAPSVFFAAQKKKDVQLLLADALSSDKLSDTQKIRLQKLIKIINLL